MKQIIAIDLDGALMRSRPFESAHKGWFNVMSVLLKDESVKEYSALEDYFGKLYEVMHRYLGDVDKETRTKFARNLFAMSVVAEVSADDVVTDFVDYLKGLKNDYCLALITSAPELCVGPILQKTGCDDIFDIVYKSPMHRQPDKRQLFKEFIQEHGKPLYYIGNGDEDITYCKELGIKTIFVNWVSEGDVKGNHDIQTVEELEEIIKRKS
ncbi:haloacid dehalogenase-like hydrolase [Candidatus Woesearchaeota archaeon]|nr:haloacid dehalogenase-like hydrolase [Candidatus Woesearchaeota archaeon]